MGRAYNTFVYRIRINRFQCLLVYLLLLLTLIAVYELHPFSNQIFIQPFDIHPPVVHQHIASFQDFRWCPENVKTEIKLDCMSLFRGQNQTVENSKSWNSPCTYTDDQMMKLSSQCHILKSQFKFWSDFYQVPKETDDYSLAFVLIGTKSAEQIVRLLQTVYNPQNIFCLTYDNKTSKEFKQTMRNLDECYENIIMPDKFIDVYQDHYSVLQTTMFCLKALQKSQIRWRYVQILSWDDFPLRTNEELVRIMKIFNGAQDCLLDKIDEYDRTRRYFQKRVGGSSLTRKELMQEKRQKLKNVPPGNLVEYKGSLSTTMTREFVRFLFTNSVSKKYYEWLNTSLGAEEMYFATMIHNLHLHPPGGYPGGCLNNYLVNRGNYTFLSRYETWMWQKECAGKYTSFSCLFGVGDLQRLKWRPEFVAHKVDLKFQPATFYCLSQLHFNRTFWPHKHSKLNYTFYENWPPVRYHRMTDKENFDC